MPFDCSSSCSLLFYYLQMPFDIFKSDLNILCTEGFPQTVISARSRTVCRPSLLTAASTFVKLPVFLSGGLPIRSAAGFPSRNLKSKLYIKACNTFLVLLTLKYRVVSFQTQNKTVLLSSAPPACLTSPFFHRSSFY